MKGRLALGDADFFELLMMFALRPWGIFFAPFAVKSFYKFFFVH